jgi:VanZ family protein
MFTPGRNASVADVGIDVTGAFLGVAVMCKVQKFISGPDKERLEDGA